MTERHLLLRIATGRTLTIVVNIFFERSPDTSGCNIWYAPEPGILLFARTAVIYFLPDVTGETNSHSSSLNRQFDTLNSKLPLRYNTRP